LEGVEESAALEEFEHGGGFAAGKDEAVEGGRAVEAEFVGSFDEGRESAGFGEGIGVGGVVALEGEDADAGVRGVVQFLSLIQNA
jgi:hypothetical protein